MTFLELESDSFQPIKKLFHFGCWHYSCPICGEVVGIYRDPKIDKVTNGLIYKRDLCKNGHHVDWSEVNEANE